MSSEAHAKLLKFSDYHGSNIFINDNYTVANGQYLKAHGQFITHAPLRLNETFSLEFRGTGIVKFTTFQYRSQALDWVQSRQPLPKGCRRIKMKGVTSYRAFVSCLQDCVRIEPEQKSKKETYILSTGPETTLAFDIECGDLNVVIFNTAASYVTFDTCNLSPSVEITPSPMIFTASLQHYNPSALCSLESAYLEPGAIFMLEVRHLGLSKDSGSYIRLCTSKLRNPYINDRWIQCCGTPVCPLYKGKRVHLNKEATEILRVRVIPEGLAIDRRSRRGLDMLICPTTAEYTLWFEIHKVSLKVWQILGYDNQRFERDISQSELCREATLSSRPPPACRPRRNRSIRCTREEHRKMSETSSSDAWSESHSVAEEKKTPIFENKCASYVSTDNWDPSSNIDNATNLNHTSSTNTSTTLSRRSIKQSDLLYDISEDPATCVSLGLDLVTLSSLESMYDSEVCGQNPPKCHAVNNSLYEKAGKIWSKNKAKPCQPALYSTMKSTRSEKYFSPKDVHGQAFFTLNSKPTTTGAPLKAKSSTQNPSTNVDGYFSIL